MAFAIGAGLMLQSIRLYDPAEDAFRAIFDNRLENIRMPGLGVLRTKPDV